MLPTIAIDGRLVADPELRFTASGKAVCSIRVAASDSKKDDAGNWQTTEQIFISMSFWEAEAEGIAEHFRKGERVVVTGRIYQREYDDREGQKRTSLEVKFPTIGKVLSTKPRDQAASRPAASAPPANDPWATTPARDSEPPF